jgi:hypothetical protein
MNDSHPTVRQIPSDRSVWLALLAAEWRTWRNGLIGLTLLWVIGFWILLLFSHPGFLLGIGLLYCILLAGAHGGSDVIDGTEEFSFALPPGRGPLFLARMVPGLGFILLIGGGGGLALATDLPQFGWSLVFSSGLTEPFAPVRDSYWYPLAVCLPLAVFAITFVSASLARSRGVVAVAWLAGLLGGAAVMGLGMVVENLLWNEVNGLLSCPALVAVATLVLLSGYHLYLRKEATKSGGQASGGSGFWTWTLVAVGVLLGLMILAVLFLRVRVVGEGTQHRLQQQHLEQQRSQSPPPSQR